MSNYPKRRSRVTVEFTDGEVRHYEISAGASLANYLNQELQSGALRLSDYDRGSAVVIPSHQIKQVEIAELSAIDPNQQAEDRDKDRAISLSDPVTDLDLSARAVARLHRAGIKTVKSLMDQNESTLRSIPGVGDITVADILAVQAELKELLP